MTDETPRHGVTSGPDRLSGGNRALSEICETTRLFGFPSSSKRTPMPHDTDPDPPPAAPAWQAPYSADIALRNEILSIQTGGDGCSDNLGIALATYFELLPECPDEETDDEIGWKPWAVERANVVADRIAALVQAERGEK